MSEQSNDLLCERSVEEAYPQDCAPEFLWVSPEEEAEYNEWLDRLERVTSQEDWPQQPEQVAWLLQL